MNIRKIILKIYYFFQNFDVNYRMIQIFKIQYLAMVVEMGCIMTASKSMIQRHKKLSAHNEQIKFWGPIFKIFISTNILKVSKLLFFCKIRSSRPHLPKWKDTISFFLKNRVLIILDCQILIRNFKYDFEIPSFLMLISW